MIRLLLSVSLIGCGSEPAAPASAEPSAEAPFEAHGAADEDNSAEPGAAGDEVAESGTAGAEVAAIRYEPVRGSVRFFVLSPEGGLLGSEQRAMDGVLADLGGADRTLHSEPPSQEEVSAIEAILAGEPAARPPEWVQIETVVAIAYAEPVVPGRSDTRHSVGPRGVAIFRGESMTPRYLSRIEPRYSTYGYNLGYGRAESRAFVKNFLRILDEEATQ